MSVKSATVEALTAEVRVLMVGSRQITLSVVRQLDWCSPELIEPFGRVRAARQPAPRELEVVGSLDGVLAYSTAHRDVHSCRTFSYCNDTGAGWCDKHRSLAEDVGWETGRRVPQKSVWTAHYWYSYRPDYELYLRWSDLPLIVLAGLR